MSRFSRRSFFPSFSVTLPLSKSVSAREMVLEYLVQRSVSLPGGHCPQGGARDIRVLYEALSTLEYSRRQASGHLPHPLSLYLDQSGTAMRFMTALTSLQEGTTLIEGHDQLSSRPIAPLVSVLRELGARITYLRHEGFLPIRVEGGRLRSAGIVTTQGWESSQYASSLFLIAPWVTGGIALDLSGLKSSLPYVEMTLWCLEKWGAKLIRNGSVCHVLGSRTLSPPSSSVGRGDWSAASYWIALFLLHQEIEEVRFTNLYLDDPQGDKFFFSLLPLFGATLEETPSALVLHRMEDGVGKGESRLPLECSLSGALDLFPTLSVLCVALGRPICLRGLSPLRYKESSRLEVMVEGFRRMGYSSDLLGMDGDDCFYYRGGSPSPLPNTGCTIDSHDDHRIAMAFGVFSTILDHPIEILRSESVDKSYPDFWDAIASVSTSS